MDHVPVRIEQAANFEGIDDLPQSVPKHHDAAEPSGKPSWKTCYGRGADAEYHLLKQCGVPSEEPCAFQHW